MVGMLARRPRFFAAVLSALCVVGVALVANSGANAESTFDAVHAELDRAAAAPGADVPVFTVVRNGRRLVVLRGKSTRAGVADLTRRLHAMPGVLSAEQ